MKTLNFNKTVATLTVICLVVIQAIPAGFAAPIPVDQTIASEAQQPTVAATQAPAVQASRTPAPLVTNTTLDFLSDNNPLSPASSEPQVGEMPAQQVPAVSGEALPVAAEINPAVPGIEITDVNHPVHGAVKLYVIRTLINGEVKETTRYLAQTTPTSVRPVSMVSVQYNAQGQEISRQYTNGNSPEPTVSLDVPSNGDPVRIETAVYGQEEPECASYEVAAANVQTTFDEYGLLSTINAESEELSFHALFTAPGLVEFTADSDPEPALPAGVQAFLDSLQERLGGEFAITAELHENDGFYIVTAQRTAPAENGQLSRLSLWLDGDGNMLDSGYVDAEYAGYQLKGWILFEALHQLPSVPSDLDCFRLMAELRVEDSGSYGEIFFRLGEKHYKAYVVRQESRVILEEIPQAPELPVIPFGPIAGGRVIVELNPDSATNKTYPYVVNVQQPDGQDSYVTIHSELITEVLGFSKNETSNRWYLHCKTIDPASGEIQQLDFGCNINPSNNLEPTQSVMVRTIVHPTTEVLSRWAAHVFTPEGGFFQRQNDLSFSRNGLSGYQDTWVWSTNQTGSYEIKTYDGSRLLVDADRSAPWQATFTNPDGAEIEYYGVTDFSYQVDSVSGLMAEVSFTAHEGSANGPVVQKHFLCSFETITDVSAQQVMFVPQAVQLMAAPELQLQTLEAPQVTALPEPAAPQNLAVNDEVLPVAVESEAVAPAAKEALQVPAVAAVDQPQSDAAPVAKAVAAVVAEPKNENNAFPAEVQTFVDQLQESLGEAFVISTELHVNDGFYIVTAQRETPVEQGELSRLSLWLDPNGHMLDSGTVDAEYSGYAVKGWVLFEALRQLPNSPNDQERLGLMAKLTVTSVGSYGEIFFTLDGENYKAYALREENRVVLEKLPQEPELPVMPFGPVTGGRVIVEENGDKDYPYVAKVQRLDSENNYVTVHSVPLTKVLGFEQDDASNRWVLNCETVNPVSGEVQQVNFGSNINPDPSSGEPTQSTMVTTIIQPTTEVQSRWSAYVFTSEGDFFQRQNDLSFSRNGLWGSQSTWVWSTNQTGSYGIQAYDGSRLLVDADRFAPWNATFTNSLGAEVKYYGGTDFSYQVDPVSGLITEVSFTGHEGSANGPIVQKHFLCSFETITDVSAQAVEAEAPMLAVLNFDPVLLQAGSGENAAEVVMAGESQLAPAIEAEILQPVAAFENASIKKPDQEVKPLMSSVWTGVKNLMAGTPESDNAQKLLLEPIAKETKTPPIASMISEVKVPEQMKLLPLTQLAFVKSVEMGSAAATATVQEVIESDAEVLAEATEEAPGATHVPAVIEEVGVQQLQPAQPLLDYLRLFEEAEQVFIPRREALEGEWHAPFSYAELRDGLTAGLSLSEQGRFRNLATYAHLIHAIQSGFDVSWTNDSKAAVKALFDENGLPNANFETLMAFASSENLPQIDPSLYVPEIPEWNESMSEGELASIAGLLNVRFGAEPFSEFMRILQGISNSRPSFDLAMNYIQDEMATLTVGA